MDIKTTPTQTTILYLLEQKDCHKKSDFPNILETKNSVMTCIMDRVGKVNFVVHKSELSYRRKISAYITPLGLKEPSGARAVIRNFL